MAILPATAGPIVGESGPDHVRILLRGDPRTHAGSVRPDAGIIRWRPRGSDGWQGPLQFRLNRNFDFTGLVVLRDLQPGTDYEFQCGCMNGDPPVSADWADASAGSFRTAPADEASAISFYLGSCSYRFFNGDVDNLDDRADKAFRAMLEREARDGPVDFCLFAGDQVYADPMHRLGDLHHQDQFFRLYRRAFSQPWLGKLLASRSNYMILDDHEIENNWPVAAQQDDRVTKYPAAIKAYQVYQASHSPAMPLDPSGRWPDRDPAHFWYRFQRGCADFFVMDVRNERLLAAQEDQRLMVSMAQEQALIRWLGERPERIKCLVSPVVMFPDQRPVMGGKDAWEGFVAQRTRILEAIRHSGARRVLVLSGDVHAALATRLHCVGPDDQAMTIHNLVCSGLFWPSALMAFRWHEWALSPDPALATRGPAADYRVERISEMYSRDAFARVDLSPSGCDFRVFSRKGEPVPGAGCRIDWPMGKL